MSDEGSNVGMRSEYSRLGEAPRILSRLQGAGIKEVVGSGRR